MALRTINLIPNDILVRRHARRHAALWLTVGVCCLLLIGTTLAYYSYFVLERTRTHMSAAEAKRRLAAAVAEAEKRRNELEALKLARELASRPRLSSVLGRLSQIMPQRAWVTEVTMAAAAPARSSLVLDGFAFTNADLGNLLRRMSGDPLFEKVLLKTSEEVAAPASGDPSWPRVLVQFRIEGIVRNL